MQLNLLARVARRSSGPDASADSSRPTSILAIAAASYGAKPSEDATAPTGFDPQAVALFETIVEGAYLVANADGVFDDEERRTFEQLVVAACGGAVAPQVIAALVSDLGDQLAEDGMDKRVEALARSLSRREHALEVLRIAALLAQASEDVSAVERQALDKIAERLGLGADSVDAALADVRLALASARA